MNISLRKAESTEDGGSIALIGNKKSRFNDYGLSKEEVNYINHQVNRLHKPQVVINRYNRYIFIIVPEDKKEASKNLEACRVAGWKLNVLVNEYKTEDITVIDAANDPASTLAVAEGLALSNYQFLKYHTNAAKKANALRNIAVYSPGISKKDIERLRIVVEGTFIARNLVNEPVCYLNAGQLAKEIQNLGKKAGFDVEVFNEAKIETLKMGGLLAVNKGSTDPPTFTTMEWKPAKPKNRQPIVLVGKGVVFDTGGINIKTAGMDTMKCDMAGAAAVAAAVYAIAKAKLPVHVVGLIPATDNRPADNAYVPGDVIKMHDGTMVEVLNTDAEGRMILADALSYAKKYKPMLVIDLATLTGAAQRAIGNAGIAAMGNNRGAMQELSESGYNVYERLAELPMWDEYGDMIKSDVGDIKNLGGPLAGAQTAAKFLEHFTAYPWIHLDIAGPAFMDKPDKYRGKGGTGTGVRLLFDFIKRKAEG